MKINYEVPTGNICVIEGSKGDLEFISVGDYGKDKNIKADFLGLTKDINGVPNGEILSLAEKWVITISTQYGCSMGCNFCDVPKVGPGVNATYFDMYDQIVNGLSLHPEINFTERLNVHFARMGEPTFNDQVIAVAQELPVIVKPHIGNSLAHPVVSTMLPKKNKFLKDFLTKWVKVKNDFYKGEAGLQFSINSTSDEQREEMFTGSSLSLKDISEIGRKLEAPRGRKYTLNFALADNYKVDALTLAYLFDSSKFMVKITPLHKTVSCEENNIKTSDGYTKYVPYKKIEEDLKNVGFDVIVFIPSEDEDLGRITCGNAILSGTKPHKFVRSC